MPDIRRSRNRLPLAVIVLTYNEEAHLPECLGSVAGLGEQVLVVDSGSDDQTVRVARALDATVVERPFTGYASQRNAALEMVDQPWVLFLDADERLTAELRQEISQAIRRAPDNVAGFWIPRRNQMFGQELHGGGWWPDRQLRLLRRGRAHYQPNREVHETVELAGTSANLDAAMHHLNYDTTDEFRQKQVDYARLRARVLANEGKRPRRRTYIGQPAREFFRRFVTLRGYRDGRLGLYLALMMAWYELLTWIRVAKLTATIEEQPTTETATSTLELPPIERDLSIIIVSYNVRELLLACLASIEASLSASSLDAEVIVVDNASNDGSPELIRRRFPWAKVIENRENNGFAAANNRGIHESRGRHIIFLNPDTTVVGDALGTLSRYLDEHPEVGVVGPRLCYPDGSTQPTRRRFPTLLTGFVESTIVQEYWRDNSILQRYYCADRTDDESQEVDWLVGACLATRRAVIEQIGGFDERFFMYSEEVEWCYRAGNAGWKILYLPDATIIHHEGGSSRQDVPSRQVNFDTSKVLLFETLHGRTAARTLKAYLLMTYLLRVAIEGSKGLLGHKPSLRLQRVALYIRAFRSGLRRRGKSK